MANEQDPLLNRSLINNMINMPNVSSQNASQGVTSLIGQFLPRPDAAQGYADLSSVLGGFSKGEKADRTLRGDWTQNYDRLMLEAQQARERAEQDALAKLASTNYIKSGGATYRPASLMIGGRLQQLPTFGFGPRGVSDAQRASAESLESQLTARLQPGGSYTPTDVSQYAKPGIMERLGSYGGAVSGGIGALDTILGNDAASTGIRNVLSKIPGLGGLGTKAAEAGTTAATAGSGLMSNILGKAVPLAGVATGTLGLLKDRGWLSNMSSGASAGAGIGSIVPGIGTAVGAGVGALAGLLRGIGGGPSQEEKEGRIAADQLRGSLQQKATPGQRAEAGGDDAALLHIIVRDNALRRGLGLEQAELMASEAVRNLWQAEKSGSGGVQAAGSRIAGMLG